MPYIKADRREELLEGFHGTGEQILLFERVKTAGELNFAITTLVDKYIDTCAGISYGNVNEVIGVLECAKLELYRRLAAPYEDKKIVENGDVYTCQK